VSHPYFAIEPPIAIGHRGCAGEAAENTLRSFERALAQGAAILETDVHLTRDAVPVLIHDDDVERNTEGSGPVSQYAFEELCRLDAGHGFSADGGQTHPFSGQSIRIPSLEQALTAFPEVRFNLELKEDRPGLVERCIEIIMRLERESLTLVTAPDGDVMEAVRAHVRDTGADVALGASTADVVAFVDAAVRNTSPPEGPMVLQVPAVFAGQALVTQRFVDTAHAAGIHVHVWTINEPSEMAALLDLGVDGLVTDHPGRLVRLLEQRRSGAA
jgi:glycerophosphoryl diester phosphodiesterase